MAIFGSTNYWVYCIELMAFIFQICQIAAYISPATEYSQFVMPFGEMNPGARRRNDMRIVTIGRFRMLKDMSKQTVSNTFACSVFFKCYKPVL